MRNVILFIVTVSLLISCTSEIKTSKRQYYLNKTNIEIVEFDNTNIFRYQLKDSSKTKLREKDIQYFSDSKDSFKIAINDSLVFKKIELNTEDSIDVYSSKYWTIKLKDNQQHWTRFFKRTDTLENGNLYHYDAYRSYYYHPENKDTSSTGGYVSSRDYKFFNKFRLKDIGPLGGELSLFSKINDNSISIIPVTSMQNDNVIRAFILEKYGNNNNKLFIGNWTLDSESTCDFFDRFLGKNLQISDSTLIFSDDSKILSEITYLLGLDSKYFHMKRENNSFGYNTIDEIKLMSFNKKYLKLKFNFSHSFCDDINTLTYKRISQ